MDGQQAGQAVEHMDAVQLAFDQVKKVEASKHASEATMAQLWCLIAIATEVRNLRQELLAGLDAAAPAQFVALDEDEG